jgi:hypothetical protein
MRVEPADVLAHGRDENIVAAGFGRQREAQIHWHGAARRDIAGRGLAFAIHYQCSGLGIVDMEAGREALLRGRHGFAGCIAQVEARFDVQVRRKAARRRPSYARWCARRSCV